MRRKETRREVRKKPSQKKSSVGVMDIILIIVGISLLLFTTAMIKLFREYGAVPDTLITCVFATLGGECGIMGWIKTTKDRNKEHQWEQEPSSRRRNNRRMAICKEVLWDLRERMSRKRYGISSLVKG